jgi:hypothetical protein
MARFVVCDIRLTNLLTSQMTKYATAKFCRVCLNSLFPSTAAASSNGGDEQAAAATLFIIAIIESTVINSKSISKNQKPQHDHDRW